ncbi:hypothetical protein [Nocardia sp. alder85J]|uniref:hypothetical protein n=1 Tax=Nocardia sp. alder85J TaxID=2862949 RepID=UPI001CD1FF42|nr:hypothetical protein [Nocardia sp. alder85J]MCX4096175.1 hypothetical protein [Nocardia sp. alder85J]
MNTPARRKNEDSQQFAIAPQGGPCSYLHHSDGSWSFVGEDGWPVSPEEFQAEAASAISGPVIDVNPESVTDTEVW